MRKLAIVTTHPIQYYAPWFKLLNSSKGVSVKVFYTWSQAKEKVQDKTFGKEIQWDIPLLEGYDYEFVENVSKNPGSNHWQGIDNPDLIPMIKKYRPDAILVFGWNMKSHFKVMRFFKGNIPVWFRGDSTLLDEKKGLKVLLRRIWLSYVYRYLDKAFYVGQENKKYFKAHGLKEKQLLFAPHAIDNKRFFDSEEKKYEEQAKMWRSKLGYHEDDIVVLFSGKLENKKNPLLLLHALSDIVASSNKNLKLLLIGNGPLEDEIRVSARDHDFVQLLPFQNQTQMPLVYRLGDIFCLPSQGPGETWGLAVNEAMACARPVIVSDKVGCAKDLVLNGENGLVFDSNDADHLKNILRKITKSSCETMGGAAVNHIQAWNFDRLIKPLIAELQKNK